MDKGQRLRWMFLLSALAVSVIASVWPEPAEDTASIPHPAPRATSAVGHASENGVLVEHAPDWVASDENPFALRDWGPPPPPSSDPRPVAQISIDNAPAPPPALPFKFLGQMVDGSDRVIYLGIGDQVFLARTGEVLDGRYKVLAITPAQIEFESMTDGAHQALPLPAQEQ